MKALILTNEYPPDVYGGAGVHVDYLSRELARLMEVEVRAFGSQSHAESTEGGSLTVRGFPVDKSVYACGDHLKGIFAAAERGVAWNAAGIEADLVHTHTWYSQLGGLMAKHNYGLPLITTVHSLEPLRPWKREQLGGGYDWTLWMERQAMESADSVIAVSEGTRHDVLLCYKVESERVKIIYNGIDPEEYKPAAADDHDALKRHGVDPSRPYLLFVGRITRQKGIVYLVEAIKYMDPGFQIVLCAGAPDTAEIATEMREAVERVSAQRPDIIWIEEMLPRPDIIQFYSHASVFCCPSIYEPFGIINLEAMACETAVVAAAVGGMKEVVVDGETGILVPLNQMLESPFEPVNPDHYAQDLARAVNELMGNPERRRQMAEAGRRRAVNHFSWAEIARQTADLYAQVLERHRAKAKG